MTAPRVLGWAVASSKTGSWWGGAARNWTDDFVFAKLYRSERVAVDTCVSSHEATAVPLVSQLETQAETERLRALLREVQKRFVDPVTHPKTHADITEALAETEGAK